jgi:organic radical activating enzyme
MSDTTLVVNEIYRAWQGEGPSAGRVCSLVRLMGCNLSCNWATESGRSACDESQTWDASRFDLRAQGYRAEAEDIADEALALAGAPGLAGTGSDPPFQPFTVITGGEPLLWQGHAGWEVLLEILGQAGARVEIETNGAVIPFGHWAVTQWNVSPKLASAGMPAARRLVRRALECHAAEPRAVFKFVAATPEDLLEVAQITGQYEIPAHRVWVMPAGTSRAAICDLAEKLAPDVLGAGWNLTLRQHHLIYDTGGEPR